ncbi:nucleotidyltransferase domain-containing protein [Methylohalobius crimeensis]|uniref:nucleotidyltransferase domain-containing protein n=1 Tax=Methylohalobius crimeensis TaxID=244365 RepID=UPI0003B76201|nr:nucleotidyltransferase domain-containing protein [Methylohalobius crimeensis]
MRLNPSEIDRIRGVVRKMLGGKADILLFGSRGDDAARGGDVDLLITIPYCVENRAMTASLLAARLERALDGRRVDVVLRTPDTPAQPIHRIAENTGIGL